MPNWNELLQKYFIEVLGVVKGVGDFAKKEIPLYVQELLTYEFYHSLIMTLVFLVMLIISIKSVFYFWKLKKGDFDFIAGVVISAIVSLVFFGNMVDRIDDAIKIKIAPRVVIVDKIQQVVNKTTGTCTK